ncbi:YdcF family protein [Parapedobacter tibetensis]|uniref:YdcF family protein n=1 Tax=Parapedobacter tibetensis TaxID=2972951 RepID=UPI00214DD4B3|nr:YdcF family protein [Parapedobacter tibetensis]
MKILDKKSWLWEGVIGVGLLVASCGHLDKPKGADAASGGSTKDSVLQRKIFPLLTVMEADTVFCKQIKTDSILIVLADGYRSRITTADTCQDAGCYAHALLCTPGEIAQAGERLKTLIHRHTALWTTALKTSGHYAVHAGANDTSFVRQAWDEVATGINRIFSVYIAGEPPHYAIIDSISFSTADLNFVRQIQHGLDSLLANEGQSPCFFRLAAHAALMTLRINGRDEAARYEPLTAGRNEEAVAAINHTRWADYPYNVLVVPGYGPEAPGIPLDSRAARRCQLAAELYKSGKAPFIIVSGGHTYPHCTPYCEAVEMKKYLINQFDVPVAAIIIEPHARHTTTNLRNAGRLIYRLGMPHDKPALVVTDRNQTAMIMDMEQRCIRELGYVPYRDLHNLNENQTEFFPVEMVSQVNTLDPLDP